MNRTVAEHIEGLENKRKQLCEQLLQESSRSKQNQLETELRAIESALTLFRSALEIEARVLT